MCTSYEANPEEGFDTSAGFQNPTSTRPVSDAAVTNTLPARQNAWFALRY